MILRRSVVLAIACLTPGAAVADGLYLPGLGLPGLGQRDVGPRPSYRETYNDFPPPEGRYGGGIVEYVMTGGRSGGLLPRAPAPVYAAPAGYVVPGRAVPLYAPAAPGYGAPALPRSGLPDYASEQPPAYYGGAPVDR